jgi:hypothetical protein
MVATSRAGTTVPFCIPVMRFKSKKRRSIEEERNPYPGEQRPVAYNPNKPPIHIKEVS